MFATRNLTEVQKLEVFPVFQHIFFENSPITGKFQDLSDLSQDFSQNAALEPTLCLGRDLRHLAAINSYSTKNTPSKTFKGIRWFATLREPQNSKIQRELSSKNQRTKFLSVFRGVNYSCFLGCLDCWIGF